MALSQDGHGRQPRGPFGHVIHHPHTSTSTLTRSPLLSQGDHGLKSTSCWRTWTTAAPDNSLSKVTWRRRGGKKIKNKTMFGRSPTTQIGKPPGRFCSGLAADRTTRVKIKQPLSTRDWLTGSKVKRALIYFCGRTHPPPPSPLLVRHLTV